MKFTLSLRILVMILARGMLTSSKTSHTFLTQIRYLSKFSLSPLIWSSAGHGNYQSSCRLNIFVHAAILCAKSPFLCSSLMC